MLAPGAAGLHFESPTRGVYEGRQGGFGAGRVGRGPANPTQCTRAQTGLRRKNLSLARVKPDSEDDIDDDGADLAALLGETNLPALTDSSAAPSVEEQAAEIQWLDTFAQLKPRHAVFVTEYLTGITATEAARRAGYSDAAGRASRLLTTNESVMRAIDAWRERQRLRGEYTVEKAMRETERGMVLAEKGNQMNAFVRAVELRARLHGLLVDKVEATIDTGPNLAQAIALARQRGAELIARRGAIVVDSQFTEISES
jgi:hypothetical protein